jgi:succinate dehydrogenase / fumarate reductase flavoprotein subunit
MLHLEHIDPETLHKRLPGITETAKIFCGVDVTKEPIPVLPTVHYNMGGVPTNYHGEVLSPIASDPNNTVQGLMAIGEAACVSVHGANRLGTNSLLDIVVFGRAAAHRARQVLTPGATHTPVSKESTDRAIERLDRMRHAKGVRQPGELRLDMQRAMQKYAAVFRSGESLTEGVKTMDSIVGDMNNIGIQDRSLVWNTDLIEAMELENLMSQALVTIRSAEQRKESRGAHAHEDFTERDDENWMKHTVMWLDDDNKSSVAYRDVTMTTLSNEVESIPPVARVY